MVAKDSTHLSKRERAGRWGQYSLKEERERERERESWSLRI